MVLDTVQNDDLVVEFTEQYIYLVNYQLLLLLNTQFSDNRKIIPLNNSVH